MAKLVSLQGANVTLPSGWSASAGYGVFNITGVYGYSGMYNELRIGYYSSTANTNGSRINYVSFYYPDFDEYSSFYSANTLSFTITGGSDVANSSLIQWFLDNNATIEGGIYEEEHTVQIINPQMYILPSTKVVGNDLVVSAEEVVVNEAEEEGLYFYIDGTKFVLPEEGITFRTLLKNYGTVNGSNIMYYGEGSTGTWSKCIYSDSDIANTSITRVFYSASGGGVNFGLKVSSTANLNSTIVTGGEYIVISGGGIN